MKLTQILFIALLIQSCVARKTSNFKEETEQRQEVEENLQSRIDLNLVTEELSETETESGFYIPLDLDMPMIITNGKGKEIKIENGIYSQFNEKHISKKNNTADLASKVETKLSTMNESKTFTKNKVVSKQPYLILITPRGIIIKVSMSHFLYIYKNLGMPFFLQYISLSYSKNENQTTAL